MPQKNQIKENKDISNQFEDDDIDAITSIVIEI